MRKYTPLLTCYAGLLGLLRSCLIRDLQCITNSCVYEKILPWEARASGVREKKGYQFTEAAFCIKKHNCMVAGVTLVSIKTATQFAEFIFASLAMCGRLSM